MASSLPSQNTPFIIPIKRPSDVSVDVWDRKPFLSKYKGYCVDLVAELAKLKNLKFK